MRFTRRITMTAVAAALSVASASEPATPAEPQANEPQAEPRVGEPTYVVEAPLAAGWPAPLVAGTIGDVLLPTFRAIEHPDFMVLLGYIKSVGMPMTAPVTYPLMQPIAPDGQAHRRFLFPTAETEPGQIPPGARVVTVPAQRVLRLSYRGAFDQRQIAHCLQRLVDAARERQLVTAGVPTLAGYNQPFRNPAEQTYEVLLPVRETTP